MKRIYSIKASLFLPRFCWPFEGKKRLLQLDRFLHSLKKGIQLKSYEEICKVIVYMDSFLQGPAQIWHSIKKKHFLTLKLEARAVNLQTSQKLEWNYLKRRYSLSYDKIHKVKTCIMIKGPKQIWHCTKSTFPYTEIQHLLPLQHLE